MTIAAATNPTTTANAGLSALLSNQSANKSGAAATAATASEQNDRFLKLLVTQMQNQDPLNPMDNAQVTTQLAQISTVSGVDKLNTSVNQMSSLLLQSQTLQGAGLVGKDVLVAGSDLVFDVAGKTSAGFELQTPADSVMVSVKNAAGKVIDTINLGAEGAGRHSFDWTAKDGARDGMTFSVSAKSGTLAVDATPLVADAVSAVYADAGTLAIELKHRGVIHYADIKAVS